MIRKDNQMTLFKYIYKSRLTYGIFLGILFGTSMFLFMGNYRLSGIVSALFSGIFFGLVMALVTYNGRSYFIQKLKEGKAREVRGYRVLLRQGMLPSEKSEYPAYAEFLRGVEHFSNSTGWAYIVGPILFGTMLLLTLIYTRQYDLSVFFAVAVAFYIVGAVIRKKRLMMVARLLQHIDTDER